MACKCSDTPDIRYELISYKEFFKEYTSKNTNNLIDDTLFLCKFNMDENIDGKLTIALLGETIIGRTGIEIADHIQYFQAQIFYLIIKTKKFVNHL